MLKYKLEVNDEARKTIIDLAMETKESTRRRKKVFIYFIVFGLLFIAIGAAKLFLDMSDGVVEVSDIVLMLAGILFIGMSFRAKPIQKKQLEKMQKRLDSSLTSGMREYIIDEDGIQLISEMSSGKLYWNAFSEYGFKGNYVYARKKDESVLLINKDDLSKEELDELMRLLSNIERQMNN